VSDCLPRVRQFLGRRKDFWSYIIETWHELGKI